MDLFKLFDRFKNYIAVILFLAMVCFAVGYCMCLYHEGQANSKASIKCRIAE